MSSPPAVTRAGREVPRAELGRILGDRLRPATAADAVDGVQPHMIAEPASAEELAQTLRLAGSAGIGVIPSGNGTKLGWGNLPKRAELVLSTARLNRVLEHAWADMTATVEAGCTLEALQSTLAQHGQRLAIDPLWPGRATIGGILATNDSGSLRVRYGSLRDLIIGITVALPDGTLAKSGGKVVKNVAGYDLPKLITGSLGTLGVITQATFRLHPLPKNSRTVSFSGDSTEALNQLLLAVIDSKMAFTGLQFRAGIDSSPQLDIRFDGTPAGIETQIEQARKLAGGARQDDSPPETWNAAQALWDSSAASLLAKVSLLPAQLHDLTVQVRRASESRGLGWKFVAQGTGIGWLRLDGSVDDLLATASSIREEVVRTGGFLVAYGCPASLKPRLDVWGPTGDAQGLMRRVKAQFDPAGILNPGRFVGGL